MHKRLCTFSRTLLDPQKPSPFLTPERTHAEKNAWRVKSRIREQMPGDTPMQMPSPLSPAPRDETRVRPCLLPVAALSSLECVRARLPHVALSHQFYTNAHTLHVEASTLQSPHTPSASRRCETGRRGTPGAGEGVFVNLFFSSASPLSLSPPLAVASLAFSSPTLNARRAALETTQIVADPHRPRSSFSRLLARPPFTSFPCLSRAAHTHTRGRWSLRVHGASFRI